MSEASFVPIHTKSTEPGIGLTYQEVVRKAKYGKRDWLFWRDRQGLTRAEPRSAESIKKCLLDCGTSGSWTLVCQGGTPMRGFWWLGVNILAQSKRGYA